MTDHEYADVLRAFLKAHEALVPMMRLLAPRSEDSIETQRKAIERSIELLEATHFDTEWRAKLDG